MVRLPTAVGGWGGAEVVRGRVVWGEDQAYKGVGKTTESQTTSWAVETDTDLCTVSTVSADPNRIIGMARDLRWNGN